MCTVWSFAHNLRTLKSGKNVTKALAGLQMLLFCITAIPINFKKGVLTEH